MESPGSLLYNWRQPEVCMMGIVIYSASPMQVFLGALGSILFILALGIAGITAAVFQRKQRRSIRILMAAAGGLLVVVSLAYAAITLSSAASPTQTVALKLDNKQVVEDNCGDNGSTCTRYVLEATTRSVAYDFNVPQDAYERAEVNLCYRFTYYDIQGSFGSNGSYQQINRVARIETSDPSTCQ
jgi:hypothetical protein